ncbi:hypothetical protein ElyMa_004204700 [Elysia marginata]|uniref:Secreted protein n=1 Tax=Elysia marginata TaxID=1093978 RepID=A0AAV4GMI0_9GAST|nr:hypothetical protein ElyMa_004204700 [Elysia marginata]
MSLLLLLLLLVVVLLVVVVVVVVVVAAAAAAAAAAGVLLYQRRRLGQLKACCHIVMEGALAHTTPCHIILTPDRPDLPLNPLCQTPGGSATDTNFKIFGLTRLGIEPVPPDLSLSECLYR